jgi:hypothetical protein
MNVAELKNNLDRGTHHDAHKAVREAAHKRADDYAQKGLKVFHKGAQDWRDPMGYPRTTLAFLAAECEAAGLAPNDAEQKEAETYWLERLDVQPHELARKAAVKEYARQRWALDELFKDCGSPMRGSQVATVQKAWTTSTTQVLFPFFYDSAIMAGILATPLLSRLPFAEIPVNSHTADHAEFFEVAGDRNFGEGGEGTKAPHVEIRARNHAIGLRQFKTKARVTYDAMRLQRLPVFERGMMRVGQAFGIQLTDCGMNVLVSGDGQTGGGAATTQAAVTNGSPDYTDVVNIHTKYTQGYETEKGLWVAPVESIRDLLTMVEFKDPLAGGQYQNRGIMPMPNGEEVMRWDVTGAVSAWLSTSILNFKPGIALVQYTEGGLLTETDRIIDGQWEDTVISKWTNFAVFDRAACIVGTNW